MDIYEYTHIYPISHTFICMYVYVNVYIYLKYKKVNKVLSTDSNNL